MSRSALPSCERVASLRASKRRQRQRRRSRARWSVATSVPPTTNPAGPPPTEPRRASRSASSWSSAGKVFGRLDRYSRLGFLDRGRIRSFAQKQIAEFDIRPTDPEAPARALSGGNQQKIVVARELSHGFRVLLAAQPTRGVDIGAVETVHSRLRRARDDGKAILLVSAELSEILALSDRVIVLYRGRVAVTVSRAEASAKVLGPYMTGVQGEVPSPYRGAAA